MAYNKNLYSSNVSALDAGIIYDQNQQLMQDEINAGIKDGDIIVGQADNLASDQNQFSTGEFIERTTGGDASLSDGDGDLILIRGSKLHEGYYAQGVELEITHASGSDITAVIDDDTFLAQMVSDSGTFTTSYSGSAWSYTPATYGITITGTPVNGDEITVTYQKEIRGTITMSNPQTFVSTGWNLYNHTLGYARVLKYHETYGFGISGTYTALQFSSTISGTKSSVTVTDGKFSIPSDGYIWVTGGNDTDTAIWMTWSDWQSEANGGTWQAYTEDTVDFSSVMTSYFPYGLMAVEGYRDEIDFSLKKATVNVGRLVYNSTNLELARSYRTVVDYDENYIYYGLPEPEVNEISIANGYMAYDHGIEYFTDTEVEVYTQTLYGVNLKNRLERDVLTLSQQTLTENQKTQVQKNIGINDKFNGIVNPNLLDNWYFVGGGSQQGGGQFPINQRGQLTYQGSTYTIDRWYSMNSRAITTISSDGLSVVSDNGINWANVQQYFENPVRLLGKRITLSMLTTGNELKSATASIPSSFPASTTTIITLTPTSCAGLTFRIDTSEIFLRITTDQTSFTGKIAAIKLELGSTQTLAHQENGVWVLNEIPNYDEQLLRCKTSNADSNDKYANQDVMTNYTVTNPNLLDNWYFAGGGSQQGGGQFPINQRGQTSYSGAVYGIDRWKATNANGNVNVTSGYLRLYGTNGANIWMQNWSDNKAIYGKQITISMLLNNGTLLTKSGSLTTEAVSSNTGFNTTAVNGISFGVFKNSGGNWFVQIANVQNGGSIVNADIVACKLELGSTQTLAHQENGVWVLNEIPNYEEQLLCCKTSNADSNDNFANNILSYNAPNPNLLDNWYFVGGGSQQGGGQFPINQRGQTAYANTTSNKYSVDRWYYSRGKIAIDSSGLTLSWDGANGANGYIQNRTEHRLGGKVLTASILFSDGTLITGTTTQATTANASTTYYNANGHEIRCTTFGADNTVSFVYLTTLTSGKKIAAIKLELGTTQTLAHQVNGTWVLNEVPNYNEQFARCAAYYVPIPNYTRCFGDFNNAKDSITILIPLSVPFARTPTTITCSPSIFRNGSGTFNLSNVSNTSKGKNASGVTAAFSCTAVSGISASAGGIFLLSSGYISCDF